MLRQLEARESSMSLMGNWEIMDPRTIENSFKNASDVESS